MTNQEAFNKVWDAYVVRGERPGYEVGKCKYPTKDGGKCAVGQLLTEEQLAKVKQLLDEGFKPRRDLYASTINDVVAVSLFSYIGYEAPVTDVFLLTYLQTAHDSAANMASDLSGADIDLALFRDYVEERLRLVATSFNLQIPEEKSNAN